MGVIVVLVAVVAGVLLYDYFTARKWQQVTSVTRNDMVFENRNKAYGAYALRKNYDKLMIIVMLSVAFTVSASFGIYNFIKSLPEEKVEEPAVVLDVLDTKPAEPEEELPPPPKELPPPPQETTVAFNPPVIVDIDVEEKFEIVQEDQKASDKDQKGNDVDPFAIQNTGGGDPPPVDIPKPKEEEILDFVEEDATFPGGNIQKWINENVVYPDVSRELGEQGKVYVEFVVETNGNITNVRVAKGVSDDLDKEAVRVIRKMPNWNPGKNNGKAVRSRCRLPINFTLG